MEKTEMDWSFFYATKHQEKLANSVPLQIKKEYKIAGNRKNKKEEAIFSLV